MRLHGIRFADSMHNLMAKPDNELQWPVIRDSLFDWWFYKWIDLQPLNAVQYWPLIRGQVCVSFAPLYTCILICLKRMHANDNLRLHLKLRLCGAQRPLVAVVVSLKKSHEINKGKGLLSHAPLSLFAVNFSQIIVPNRTEITGHIKCWQNFKLYWCSGWKAQIYYNMTLHCDIYHY